jgi:predicted dinucleotide-binding enzyme
MAVSTAIIGVGNIGTAIAGHLVAGGERVVLAATAPPAPLARQLGDLASAATVEDAIAAADVVIVALMFDVSKGLIEQHHAGLAGKVVVDPSNPVAINDKGEFSRTLPDGVSAGSVIAGLLPASAHFVKAFGTLYVQSLATGAHRAPARAVLFYATDDRQAQAAIERLIAAAGFDAVHAGGVDAAIRLELFGDLNGKLMDVEEARAALAGTRA